MMNGECRGIYSGKCMKLGLLSLMSRAGSYRLLNGLTVTAEPVHPPHSEELKLDDPANLDHLLLNSMAKYLASVSINVRVMDKETPLKLAGAYYGNSSASGRKKDKYGGALAAMGLMSGGTMLALGMSALAAMAGKALMASMLAMMLAAIAALKGGGEEKTTYEVISKPVVSHHLSHSSEVQHSAGHYRRNFDRRDIPFAAQMPTE
ncbi:hypothetical protein AAG570_009389 [Ranatra chinensis]|uniref:Uncharacterized protein n=1 Tax=Ranatra chinensis TaxID=642074 RepID=A0ABD0ZA09_9HEMI